jgi:hypothetical protein
LNIYKRLFNAKEEGRVSHEILRDFRAALTEGIVSATSARY